MWWCFWRAADFFGPEDGMAGGAFPAAEDFQAGQIGAGVHHPAAEISTSRAGKLVEERHVWL